MYVDLKSNIVMTSSQKVNEICTPLFKFFNINFFDFVRVYKDQGRICLSTDGPWNQLYYKSGFYLGRIHEYYYQDDISNCSIEDFQLQNVKTDKERIKTRNIFDHAHAFQIIKTNHQKGYKDTYTFASKIENADINELYINFIDIISDFIDYFLIASTPIIIQAEKEKFYFPETAKELSKPKPNKIFFPVKEFYQQIKLNKMPIRIDNDDIIYLCNREIQCMKAFVKGKSAKGIAKNLGVSYRTVETHLNNIKVKMKCYSKEELADKILSNEIIKNYLFNKNF